MSLDRHVAALARLPIFSAFEPEALRLIAFASEPVHFSAGDVVVRNGEDSNGGFLVLSGSLILDLGHGSMEQGKVVGPGALIGEIALFTATTQPATAIARENTTVLKIPRTLIRRVLDEFPESAKRAAQALRHEIARFGKDLEQVRQVTQR